MKQTKEDDICINNDKKLLSICFSGKDDNYMPDFIYRITTTINHFAKNIKELGRLEDVEIVVTDWGSKVPLAQTLRLLPEAVDICRFIYVPIEIVKKTQNGKDYYNIGSALNTCVRRSYGKFILVTAADQLMLKHSLDTMLKVLSEDIRIEIDVQKTLMMIPRYQIPWHFLERRPSLEEWDRYLLLNEYSINKEETAMLFVLGAGGGYILHKNICKEVRNIDESFPGWGWHDIDIGFRLSQKYSFIWLSNVGVWLFHMDHPPSGRRASSNPHIYNPNLQANNKDWGLKDFELMEQKAKINIAYNSTGSSVTNTENNLYIGQYDNKKTIEQLQSNEIASQVKCIIRYLLINEWPLEKKDLDALFFLTWYSVNYFPRRYLEIGIGKGYTSAAVTSSCPSVEVYGVDYWDGIVAGKTPVNLSNDLYNLGFKGYIRFVNGDIRTAINRIKDSFIGNFCIDLAYIRTELIASDLYINLATCFKHLAPGGVLVLSSHSEEKFKTICDNFKNNFPEASFIQSSNKIIGMFYKSSSINNVNVNHNANIVNFDKKWVKYLKIKIFIKNIFSLGLKIYNRLTKLMSSGHE